MKEIEMALKKKEATSLADNKVKVIQNEPEVADQTSIS